MVNLPKKGFSIPIDNWLRNELSDDLKETLLHQPFFGEEFIDKEALHQTVQDYLDRKNNISGWGIWHLYVWQKWSKTI